MQDEVGFYKSLNGKEYAREFLDEIFSSQKYLWNQINARINHIRLRQNRRPPFSVPLGNGLKRKKKEKKMKNSFDQYISKKILNDLSLRKDLEDAEQAVSIAQQLYDLRKNRGLTQTQFAKLIGVSQPNIARLESGDYKSYSLKTLNKAAVALKSEIKVKIAMPEETQTVSQVWKFGFCFFSHKKNRTNNTETKNINKVREVPSTSFYNYSIC